MKVFNTETNELVFEKAGLHSMGIMDFVFTSSPNEVITCSNDRTAKVWTVNIEAKTVDMVRELVLSEDDLAAYKENVDKQSLGIIGFDKSILSVSMNSDINSWEEDNNSASHTLRGHANSVSAVANFNDKGMVSVDLDGRILFWSVETGEAQRPTSQMRHKIQALTVCTNSNNVYTSSQDSTMGHFVYSDGTLKPARDEMVKKHFSIKTMTATDEHVYVLYNDKSIEVLKADDVSSVVVRTD